MNIKTFWGVYLGRAVSIATFFASVVAIAGFFYSMSGKTASSANQTTVIVNTGGSSNNIDPQPSTHQSMRSTINKEDVYAVIILDNNGLQFSKEQTRKSTASLRAAIEQLLYQSRAKLVERANIDAVVKELQFQQTGLVNKESQLRLGKLLGATKLVYGMIEDILEVESEFSGFDTAFSTVSTSSIITLKVVDVQSGEIVYTTRAEGEPEVTMNSKHGKVRTNAAVLKSIENSITKLHLSKNLLNSRP